MPGSTQSFYDDLAASYHLIFADWESSIERQAAVLDTLIRSELGELGRSPDTVRILDCACGIGTQAIGLALRGYTVHATDLSPAEIERASREASRLGASITTAVADFRTLADQVEGQFDVVIAFDNALPHLLTDTDLSAAARNIAAKVAPGGLLLASIRDYDKLRVERPQFDGLRQHDSTTPGPDTPMPTRIDGPDGRRIVFQMWDWDASGDAYTLNQFILREVDQGDRAGPAIGGVDPVSAGVDRNWITEHYQARYRALTRAEMENFFGQAGFDSMRWNTSDYYQPVFIARQVGNDSQVRG